MRNERMKKLSTQGFQFIAGNLALDFVNTVGNRLGKSREYLNSSAAFNRWAFLTGLVPEHTLLKLSTQKLKTIWAFREELYGLFQSIASGAVPTSRMLAPLNARLAAVAPKRRLACQRGQMKRGNNKNSGVSWGWNIPEPDPDLVLAPILLSAAELLVEGQYPKVGSCEDETCGWLFLDRSQAGRRRWCSMDDCGNRAKVHKHYLGRKTAAATSSRGAFRRRTQ